MPKGWRRYAPDAGHVDDQLVWNAMEQRGMTREEACEHVNTTRNQRIADQAAIAEAERRRVEVQKRELEDLRQRRELEETAKLQDQTTLDQIRPPPPVIRDGAREPEPVRGDEDEKPTKSKGRKHS